MKIGVGGSCVVQHWSLSIGVESVKVGGFTRVMVWFVLRFVFHTVLKMAGYHGDIFRQGGFFSMCVASLCCF